MSGEREGQTAACDTALKANGLIDATAAMAVLKLSTRLKQPIRKDQSVLFERLLLLKFLLENCLSI